LTTGKVSRALIVITLAMLLAGSSLPAARAGTNAPAPADPAAAIQKAVAWLHTQQLPDGGFGLGTSSAAMTADVVYALALVGENPAGPAWTVGGHSALDALKALAPGYVGTDAGQAGKVARAVALAGGNPANFGGLNLVQIIQNTYNPATGRYHASFLYRHTLAVEGLLRAGVTVPPAALTALRQAQLKDGGWFWAFGGTTSDIDTTGRVLQLVAGLAGVSDTGAYCRALDYLERYQLATGGWNDGMNPGPANANSTALAVGGLRAAGLDPQSPRFQKADKGAADTLLSFQELSGAFVYIREAGKEEVRLMATADALAALAGPGQARSACQRPYLPVFYIF
jgi:hypothetical protein